MATAKPKQKNGQPTRKQLAARRKFAAMSRRRAREAKAAKRRNGVLFTHPAKPKPTAKPKGPKKPAPKRRNSEAKDSGHPIEVRRYFRSGPPGYMTPWQRAESHGQQRLFKMNPRRRNAIGELVGGAILTRQVEKELAKQRGFNPARRRNNAPAGIEAIHQNFLGRPTSGEDVMAAPGNTPRNLAQLGKLVKVITETETFNFNHRDNDVLAANARGELFIVGDSVIESNADFGHIRQLEYLAVKSHLDNKPVVYFHKFGDEGGKRPRLQTDADGRFHIVGGDYTIEVEGITD